MIIFMGLSLQDRMALLPAPEREAWIREQPPWIIEEIQRGEWWWVARPEQVPPPGGWFVCLALAGRGFWEEQGGCRVDREPDPQAPLRSSWSSH